MGRNWYQSASIALVLGHWTFFFNFKGPASWILQKMFRRQPKLLVMLERNGGALKMVYR
jgi:hypothetical protein